MSYHWFWTNFETWTVGFYSALNTTCSSIVNDSKDKTLNPIVVWIAVCPNTTNTWAIHHATPDILHILPGAKITDVVVKWSEALVQLVDRLVILPMMSVDDSHNPKFGLNHPFNTGLGIPISKQYKTCRASICSVLIFQVV